jgi:signal transduction histidine kinase
VREDPSPAQRIAAYRVVQEALSNASHHSGTREQWVKLVREGDWVTITVQDRGAGFEPGQESSTRSRRARLGLQGMRDRTELLGGTFNITSAPGRGTLVEARIPLRQGEDNVR